MLCNTIPQLLKTLPINSFPLRLYTTPQRNISCICLSKTLLSHPSRFRRTSCLSSSATSLVYSMFFPRNSSFFQTILLRVISMQFLCYSQPFESFLRLRFTRLLHSITFHCSSIPLLNFSLPFYSIAEPIIAVTPHRKAFLSLIYQTSRLNRSFCSQVSDSLAVYSSHRGNRYIRC